MLPDSGHHSALVPKVSPGARGTFALASHLPEVTGLSVRNIVQTLRPLQQISVHIAGHEHVAHDPLTPQAQEILHALNIDPN